MRIAWYPLFRVRLRHEFYSDGASTTDFICVPLPGTREMLREHGLLWHGFGDGFGVFAEVDPATLPDATDPARKPVLRTLTGDEVLRMQFALVLRNPYLVNFTALPALRPGSEVFYFDNLRSDTAGGPSFLGDSVADARVGSPILWVDGPVYTHRLSAPAPTATIELRDMFGQPVKTVAFDYSGAPEPARELRIDLSKIDGLEAGRYSAKDDQGGAPHHFFYDPQGFEVRPFAVVEVFTSTVGLVAGASKVPVPYRVFQGNQIRRVDDFHLQWQARQTLWRYRVTKKYVVPAPGIPVASLQIGDGSDFDAVVDGSDKVTFTAKALRALSQQPAELVLNHNGNKKIRKLPSPRPEAPLKKETVGAVEREVSELFIYI